MKNVKKVRFEHNECMRQLIERGIFLNTWSLKNRKIEYENRTFSSR